jgi:hypothetical protein
MLAAGKMLSQSYNLKSIKDRYWVQDIATQHVANTAKSYAAPMLT